MIKRISLLILLTFACFSCDRQQFFSQYYSTNGSWHRDSVARFTVEQQDTLGLYNLVVNLRNNKNYPYQNLFLIVSMEQPDGNTRVDTLEYIMAQPDGQLLGKGFSDIKENRLLFKEKVRFTQAGAYQFEIRHAMRQLGAVAGLDALEGVTEIGLSVETLKTDTN